MTTPAASDQTPATPLSMPHTRPASPATSPVISFFTASQVRTMIEHRAKELPEAKPTRG